MDDRLTSAERANVEGYRNFGHVHLGDVGLTMRDTYQAIIDRIAPKPAEHKRCWACGYDMRVESAPPGVFVWCVKCGVRGPWKLTVPEAWAAWDAVFGGKR